MESYNEFGTPKANTVSNFGLISKTLLGTIIVFLVALPRLFEGKLFLEFLYKTENIVLYLILTLAVTILLGLIWTLLYRALQTNKGFILNMFTFVVTCWFLGLFIGNALIFAVYFIAYYANGAIDAELVANALEISAVGTMIAIFGGTIMLPRLSMTGTTVKFFKNVSIILVGLTLATFILWIIGMILSIFGLDFILRGLYQMLYGLGPISIIFSVLIVIAAVSAYLVMLGRAKMAVGNEPRHLEYFYSMLLVNAIARVYVEIFKLVLKLLARNQNRD